MKEHINLPRDITEFYFSVIDNEGTGDCFYQVILDSTVFQREYAQYGPDNVQLLRTDIQRFAKRHEDLSQKIFELFNDQKQKEDFAIWNLQFSCQSNDREDSNWAFELLSKNKDYLKEIKKKKKILSKTCRKIVKDTYEKDENYCNQLVNYFNEEEFIKLAMGQWIHDIGEMKSWAGDSEMILFSHLFDLHIITFKNTEQGIEIDSTWKYLSALDDQAAIDKPNLNNTVFMWAMDAEHPCRPLKRGETTAHYAALNLTTNSDPFVGPDIFTFERITWEQNDENETS
jgi:hypothetical protein